MYTCHHTGRWSIWRPRLSTKMEQYVHSCLNKTAITADTTAKIPMAESCNRTVPTRKHYLSNHSRLFLLISRSSHSIINHFKDHHPSPEKHVCYIWHTWNGGHNGAHDQYTRAEFQQFTEEYGFLQIATSLHTSPRAMARQKEVWKSRCSCKYMSWLMAKAPSVMLAMALSVHLWLPGSIGLAFCLQKTQQHRVHYHPNQEVR